MEKNDYVICWWPGVDIVPNYEYDIVYDVTHNQAVDKAKKEALKASIDRYSNSIIHEIEKELPLDPADAYEEIMDDFIRFAVWKIDPNISKEAWDEFDFGPDIFCSRYCERVA
jgi:hypothetical protein